MSRHRDGPSDCKVYVGDLGSTASKADIEDAFSYYGTLRNVWVARNPPGFAFVEFEDARDAEDAVRGLDGRMVCGRRVRVEPSCGARAGRFGGFGPPSRRNRPFHPEDRCYECGDRGHYARDCSRFRRGGRRSRSRSRTRRSRSRSDSRSKSRSRSRSRSRRRSRSRSRNLKRSRSRSASNHKRSRSVSRSKKRSRSASRSRSRSRSADKKSRSRSHSRSRSRSKSKTKTSPKRENGSAD